LVVLNLLTGKYFGFNSSAGVVWEAMTQGCALASVEEKLPNEISSESFLSDLLSHELLKSSDAAKVELPADLAARLASVDEQPEMAVFEDLSDMIMADPIHDTDTEFGWPVESSAKS